MNIKMTQYKCPKCGSENFKKGGFLKSGKQRLVCKDCGKSFSTNESIQDKKTICVYCNSQNTVKAGKTKWGRQIYLCNDCHKRFNENKIDEIEVPCPICGGELRYKGWSNNGHNRRYRCSSCGKMFSGNPETFEIKEKVVDKPCPYCGSNNIKRSGTLKSGAKRYKCKDCGKGFSENTVIQEKPYRPDKCPKCGGIHINLSGRDTKTNKQRYKCMECGYKFVENPTQPTFTIYEETCPYCGHVGARKAGKSSKNKQYYQCLKCNHKYMNNQKFQHTTPYVKKLILEDLQNGMTKLAISKKYGVSDRTIISITKGHELVWKRKLKEEVAGRNRLKQIEISRKKRAFRVKNLQEYSVKLNQEFSTFQTKIPQDIIQLFNNLFKEYEQDKIKKYVFEELYIRYLVESLSKLRNLDIEYVQKQKQLKVQQIIDSVFTGNTLENISNKYKVDINYIKDLVKDRYRKEKLTPEQQDTIIKFGVGACVPSEYIAPYIPCSIKICERILSKYTIKQRPKVILTEQEKALDKMVLDKFIMR